MYLPNSLYHFLRFRVVFSNLFFSVSARVLCVRLRNVFASNDFAFYVVSGVSERISCPNRCGRTYKNKISLQCHLRNECGTQPKFFCPFCDKKCYQKSNMKSHIVQVHKTFCNIEPIVPLPSLRGRSRQFNRS